MKFSTAVSLGLAPVALAKAVHNVYPGRRDTDLVARKHGENKDSVGSNSILINEVTLDANEAFLLGQVIGAQESQVTLLEQVVLLWVNGGAGAATTIINQPGAAATPPPAAAPPPAAQSAPPAAAAPPSPAVNSGSTGTAAATGTTHSVDVGAAGLTYSPSSIEAAIGDTVIFSFRNANHTVTQSGFTTACDPLAGGMDSGFQPNANGTVNPPPQVAMQVQVSTPLWFYCRQTGHCGKGMTFAINPTANKTEAQFQANAIAEKGQGSGSAITGGGSSAAAPPAGGAASSSSLTATIGSPAASTAAAPATASTGINIGTGSINADGSCTCAVVCGAGSFPSAQQGVAAFGGVAGSLPNGMVMTV